MGIAAPITAYTAMPYLDEDDGRANIHQTVELAENVVLVGFRRAVHVHLGNTLHSKFLLPQLDLVGVRREGLCIF